MTIELISIFVSFGVLIIVYGARIKSSQGKTILFSEKFLQNVDEKIFEFVKFIFKLYSLLFTNISAFLSKIPHKIIHSIHAASHTLAQKSSLWIEKFTHKK